MEAIDTVGLLEVTQHRYYPCFCFTAPMKQTDAQIFLPLGGKCLNESSARLNGLAGGKGYGFIEREADIFVITPPSGRRLPQPEEASG
jgi:hypothetical protein